MDVRGKKRANQSRHLSAHYKCMIAWWIHAIKTVQICQSNGKTEILGMKPCLEFGPFRHLQCAAGVVKTESLAPKAWRIFGSIAKTIYVQDLLKTWKWKSCNDNEIVRAKTSRGFEEHPPWEVEPFESKWWCHGKAGKRLHLPQHEFKIPQLTSVNSLQQLTSNWLQPLWFLAKNGSCVGELTMQTPWASKSSPSLSLGVALNDELWTWTWQGELGTSWHLDLKSQIQKQVEPHVISCPKERRQWRAKSLNDAQWVPAQRAHKASPQFA